MPGEKGDIGDVVGARCHLPSPTWMTSTVGLSGLTCLSPFNRAALEILVLLVTVE